MEYTPRGGWAWKTRSTVSAKETRAKQGAFSGVLELNRNKCTDQTSKLCG